MAKQCDDEIEGIEMKKRKDERSSFFVLSFPPFSSIVLSPNGMSSNRWTVAGNICTYETIARRNSNLKSTQFSVHFSCLEVNWNGKQRTKTNQNWNLDECATFSTLHSKTHDDIVHVLWVVLCCVCCMYAIGMCENESVCRRRWNWNGAVTAFFIFNFSICSGERVETISNNLCMCSISTSIPQSEWLNIEYIHTAYSLLHAYHTKQHTFTYIADFFIFSCPRARANRQNWSRWDVTIFDNNEMSSSRSLHGDHFSISYFVRIPTKWQTSCSNTTCRRSNICCGKLLVMYTQQHHLHTKYVWRFVLVEMPYMYQIQCEKKVAENARLHFTEIINWEHTATISFCIKSCGP